MAKQPKLAPISPRQIWPILAKIFGLGGKRVTELRLTLKCDEPVTAEISYTAQVDGEQLEELAATLQSYVLCKPAPTDPARHTWAELAKALKKQKPAEAADQPTAAESWRDREPML